MISFHFTPPFTPEMLDCLGDGNRISGPVSFDQKGFYLSVDTPEVELFRKGAKLAISLGRPQFAEMGSSRQEGDAADWLALHEQFGERAAQKVRGRFAVAILDAAANVVFLATDRFGTMPWCYAIEEKRLAVSDRVDGLKLASRRIDPQAIFDYLYFHMIPAPGAIFKGVKRLPAGHVLVCKGTSAQVIRYWTLRFEESKSADLEASKQRFRVLIEEAVAREAEACQAGAFLSGGTDSSTVSGMLTKVLAKPAKTYSIGFDAAGYDEMEYARIASRHFNTEHHEYYVTPEDLLEGIPKIASYYDQPFGNSSVVPAWFCARMAKADGVDKLLAGDGGDELFGGNSRYAKQRVFGVYEMAPVLLRRAMIEPLFDLGVANRIPLVKKAASYVRQAKVPLPERMETYNPLSRLDLREIFEPEFLAQVDEEAPLHAQRETWNAIEAKSQLNRMLAFDWKYTLADNDLPKVIGATRLAGLDVGFPLLSDELLEFSMSLPPEWKLRGLTLRWFFKEALRGFLPDEIIAKKKHGFGLPFGVWVCRHAGLKSLIIDVMTSLKNRAIVRPVFVDTLLQNYLPIYPEYYGEMVWVLMILELWIQSLPAEYNDTCFDAYRQVSHICL